MVLLMFYNVVNRYMFGHHAPWQQEIVLFIHSAIFLLAAGYVFSEDKHVRVDVFYRNLSVKKKAMIDMLGIIFFLIPTCIAIIYFSYGFVINSWKILEHSPENNGMAGIFLFKSLIILFAVGVLISSVPLLCGRDRK